MQKLYCNGTIETITGKKAEAILTENGKIKAVGSLEDLKSAAPNAERINLDGKALLPSFIDSHSHFSAYASSLLQVSLEDSVSLDEIASRIQSFIKENYVARGEWVIAKGYDHNSIAGGNHPDAAFLDKVCPDNPIVIQHASGHMGVFNSSALKLLNVSKDTIAPGGGTIGKTESALSGYMEENAFFEYLQKVPMPDIQKLREAYIKAQQKYASHGITTVQDGYMVSSMIPMLKDLTDNNLLRLDLVGYAGVQDYDKISEAFSGCTQSYINHFRLSGYKMFLDGSPQGRTAWMRTPYENSEQEYKGYGTMDSSAVLSALSQAAQKNIQILAHCNGDAAAQQMIDCAKQVSDIRKIRPVMIHAQLLGIDQLDDVKDLGIIPSFFVAHVYHWGDIHIKNFGLERASHISPLNSALKRGILFTLHQDSPVIEPNMLETLGCAACRRTKSGVLLGEDEKISVYEALKAITINAAYQYFEEEKKGSIEAGKNADFVILDRNPLETESDALTKIKVLATIKDDEFIYNIQ